MKNQYPLSLAAFACVAVGSPILGSHHLSARSHHSSYTALLRPWQDEIQPPSIQVNINGAPRWFIVDTGSADTFVYTENTTCLIDGKKKPQEDCAFGDVYTGTYEPIKDMVFNQTYGTGQVISGQFGYATVEVAGITIKKQRVAFATTATKNGFIGTSGILGLAPHQIEAAFATSDPTLASAKNQVFYPTVFESMYNVTGQVDPTLSFAMEPGLEGGYLTFGGPPPVSFDDGSASVPIEGINIGGSPKPNAYYPFQPDGYVLNGAQHNTSYRVAVDSGTYVSRLPEAIVEAFNGAFDPPAKFHPSISLYSTSCNATIPKFGLTIGGRTFHVAAQNLLVGSAATPDTCYTSITKGFDFSKKEFPDGFYVLGDLFMIDRVVSFDVGKKQIRFADRV